MCCLAHAWAVSQYNAAPPPPHTHITHTCACTRMRCAPCCSCRAELCPRGNDSSQHCLSPKHTRVGPSFDSTQGVHRRNTQLTAVSRRGGGGGGGRRRPAADKCMHSSRWPCGMQPIMHICMPAPHGTTHCTGHHLVPPSPFTSRIHLTLCAAQSRQCCSTPRPRVAAAHIRCGIDASVYTAATLLYSCDRSKGEDITNVQLVQQRGLSRTSCKHQYCSGAHVDHTRVHALRRSSLQAAAHTAGAAAEETILMYVLLCNWPVPAPVSGQRLASHTQIFMGIYLRVTR